MNTLDYNQNLYDACATLTRFYFDYTEDYQKWLTDEEYYQQLNEHMVILKDAMKGKE